MFMYHLCIIIILYKREREVRGERCMGAGGLHTRTSKRFVLFFSFLPPKYIILVNHFFFHSFMQNSYSDNRYHGVSYYFVRVLLARAHEPPRD